MTNAFTHALRLLGIGLKQNSVVKIVAALDAIQPPVAILGAFCAVLALLAPAYSTSPVTWLLSNIPLFLFIIYGTVVVVAGRKDGIEPSTVVWAPVYLAWRLMAFILAWSIFDVFRTSDRRKRQEHT